MSKGRNRKKKSGTDKQRLAAAETPVAMHDAEQPAEVGALHDMSSTTISGATGMAVPVAEGDSSVAIAAQTAEPVAATSGSAAAPEPDLFTAPASPAPTVRPSPAAELRIETAGHAPHGSIGQRLRAAREVRGWSIEEVGTRLHIPAQIIRALEAEQFDRIGYGVYLRGYLSSYARLVDVPTILVDNVVRERSQTPPLVASGTISHSRYLYQRYSVSALYLILTGVIIVPAVLLAMRASLQPGVTQLTPLDAPAASAAVDPAASSVASDAANGQTPGAVAAAGSDAAPGAPPEAPLVASLAPFSALSHKEAAHAETTAAASAPAAAPPPPGSHTLKLTLKEASWVEVVAANGEKLEYGLLAGGTTRSYTSSKALEVRLGNSSGAEVETDGQVQDLAPYRRSNVAHFRLFTAGEPISRTD